MSAMNGQTIRADMYVNGVRIGRASASLDTFDTQTNTASTTILDLETSNTLDLLYDLAAGDEVCHVATKYSDFYFVMFRFT